MLKDPSHGIEEGYSIKLTGVTYQERQPRLAKLRGDEPIEVKRCPYNPYDRNAIDVVLVSSGESLGWIPRKLAAQLAPPLDQGRECFATIESVIRGTGLPYGLNIRLVIAPKEYRSPVYLPEEGDCVRHVTLGYGIVIECMESLPRRPHHYVVVARFRNKTIRIDWNYSLDEAIVAVVDAVHAPRHLFNTKP